MGAKVAVIGAGPAGAAAALALSRAGHRVHVYERAPHVGGRTATKRSGGLYLDTGAGFLTNFYPRVFKLADELGMRDDIRLLERVTGLHNGDHVARLNVGSATSFMRFPWLTLGDKLKMSAWTAALSLKRRRLDLSDPRSLADYDHESIAEHTRAHLSERVYQHLIRPGIEPFWYFHCEEASAGLVAGLTAHAAGAQFYYVAGGIDSLCQAMLQPAKVHLSANVTSLDLSGASVCVSLEGQTEPKPFDAAVIATTASVAAKLTQPLWDRMRLPDAQRAFLSSQRYAANVHVAFEVHRLERDPGVNSVFPCGPGPRDIAALSFQRAKLPNENERELVSVYLSDHESRRVAGWSDERVSKHAYEMARALYGALPPSAEVFTIARRSEAIPIHEVGRYRAAAEFDAAQRSMDSNITFCGDYLASATIDGAVASGQRAAASLALPLSSVAPEE